MTTLAVAVFHPLVSLALLLLGTPAAPQPAPPLSDRSTELVRLDCGNQLGRREVTLFANGTVRRREGERGRELMALAELGPDELAAFLRRMEEEDLSEVGTLDRGVEGDWVERCDLALALPGRAFRSFRYGRYDTLPLPLARLLRVIEDVAAKVVEPGAAERLPEGYEPRAGDVLRRLDGQLFEVVAETSDHKGIELWGVDQPFTLYIPRDKLRSEFVALVSRRRR
jgi:hypothetical protein